MNLLELEVNEAKTRANAKKILKRYRGMKRMLSHYLIDSHAALSSKRLSDMPINHSNQNIVEAQMIKKLDGVEKYFVWKKEIECIEEALEYMDDRGREAIERTYLVKDEKTQSYIALEMGYSLRGLENLLQRSLLEFAETYKGGEIVVWK